MFAKLFDSKTYGQILVKKGDDDIGRPAIVSVIELEGIGLCSIKLCFNSDKEHKVVFDEFLNKVDLKTAEETARQIFNAFNELGEFHERS